MLLFTATIPQGIFKRILLTEGAQSVKIRGSSAPNTTEGSICTLCAFGMCILLL